jgi:hypothetical protein
MSAGGSGPDESQEIVGLAHYTDDMRVYIYHSTESVEDEAQFGQFLRLSNELLDLLGFEGPPDFSIRQNFLTLNWHARADVRVKRGLPSSEMESRLSSLEEAVKLHNLDHEQAYEENAIAPYFKLLESFKTEKGYIRLVRTSTHEEQPVFVFKFNLITLDRFSFKRYDPRRMQTIYRRVARSAAIGYVSLLILLITTVLCLANVGLSKYVAIGLLTGIIFWRWPGWTKFVLAAAILIVILAACTLQNEVTVPPPPTQFYWPVVYEARIELSSSGRIWTVDEEMTVPASALRQITEGGGQYEVNLPPPQPDQYQIDIERLTEMLGSQGLTLTGVENGTDPVFSFPQRMLTHSIPMVPFITTQAISFPYVVLFGNVHITPANDSSVLISGPRGVIEATTPGSAAVTTATGEERLIGAESFSSSGTDSVSISVSTLSILARDEPLRMIAGLSLSTAISWAVACAWALLVALMQTGARVAAKSGWKRVHHTKSSPHTGKTEDKAGDDKTARPKKTSDPTPENPAQ